MPIVFGGVYLSKVIVPLVFGEQWIEAIPLFSQFLCMTFAGLLVSVFTDVFTLTGKVKEQFYYELATSVMFLLIMLPASYLTLEQFTLCRAIIPYIMLFTLLMVLNYLINISIVRIFILFLPVAISSLFMVLSLEVITKTISFDSVFFYLAVSVVLGAGIYVAVFVSLIHLLKNRTGEYEFLYKTFILQILSKFRRFRVS